jgi:hypothetical protein
MPLARKRDVAARLADPDVQKLLLQTGALVDPDDFALPRASLVASASPSLDGDAYWRALEALQRRVDATLRNMVDDGFDGVVDIRLFPLDPDGRTLRASIVEVDDENARLPAGDGTARWHINAKEQRRIA